MLNIGILGCGWLGLDLGKRLVKLGYAVKGSTTSKDRIDLIKNENIQPFIIKLSETEIKGDIHQFLSNCDILVIAVPPGLRRNPHKNYVKEMTWLSKPILKSSVKYLLYISSTSVYKDEIGFPTVYSDTPPNNLSNSAKQLIAVEEILSSIADVSTTILRFSGLIGEDRHPGYYLQGKTNLANPFGPINLIHKTDCINIILQIIQKEIWGTIFNAAYPLHPNRKSYYTEFCKKHNLPQPVFIVSGNSKGKVIDSSKLLETLNYSFEITP